jgi:hypothetical protein
MVLNGLKQELTKKSRILKNKFVYLSIEINKNKNEKSIFNISLSGFSGSKL